ncbi:ankyrin-3-like [Microplitis mediator]|uniref:ankyrin-3-like n=1 Tax=Microplitis mediator TaxID=375433 RepID=UPI0025547505|nr:ankyrin-3-like [Microplitis mediator]
MSGYASEDEIQKLRAAITKGDEDEVRKFLSGFQEQDKILSAILKWDEGYDFLRVSLKEKWREIGILLLKHGVEVNKINCRQTHNSPLFWAILNEDIEIVEMIIAKGADVNYKNSSGKLAIFGAVEKNNQELVNLLLAQKNVVVNSKNIYVPLEAAAKVGNQKIFDSLVRQGATANTSYSPGETIFQIAVERGYLSTVKNILNEHSNLHEDIGNKNLLASAIIGCGDEYKEIVNLLTDHGFVVDPDYINNNKLVAAAVYNKYYKITEDLLKLGAAVNVVSDFHKSTPLRIACEKNSEDFVKLLLKYGADVNFKGQYNMTALYEAVRNSYFEITKLLLDNNATIGDQGLLHNAVLRGSTEIVRILLDRGANIHGINSYGMSALHRVTYITEWNKTKEGVEIAKLLLARGANLNLKNQDGETPVVCAVKNERSHILKVFIDNMEHVDNPCVNDMPLLHYASSLGKAQCVRAILKCKAKVNHPTKVTLKTPLHFAVSSNKVCEILIKVNANVNAKDWKGRTPLHYCILEKADLDVVETLLKNNADVDCLDEDELTPLVMAGKTNRPEYIDILLKYQADVKSVSQSGKTALHYFSKRVNEVGFRKLLSYNADADKEWVKNRSPSSYFVNVHRYYRNYNNNHQRNNRRLSQAEIIEKLQQCKSIIRCHAAHIARLYVLDYFVKAKESMWDKAKETEDKLNTEFCNDVKIIPKNFLVSCKEELNKMKRERIGTSGVKFFSLFERSNHQIARLAQNESIEQVFKSDVMKDKFPVYNDMLEARIKLALHRKEIIDKDEESCIYAFFGGVPQNCCEEIFDYLDTKSLNNFITASKTAVKLREFKPPRSKSGPRVKRMRKV